MTVVLPKKVTELDEDLTPSLDDLLFVTNDPDGAPVSKKVSIGNLAKTLSDHAGVVNVLDYGAKGDGVTDDTAAIQAMLDYAKSLMPSGLKAPTVLYFPHGQYKISSGLTYTPADGNGYTIFRGEYTKTYIFSTDDITALTVGLAGNDTYGIFIDSIFFRTPVSDSATKPVVKLIRPKIGRIKHCYLTGGSSGIEMDGAIDYEISSNWFEAIRGGLTSSGGIYLHNTSQTGSYNRLYENYITGLKTNAIMVRGNAAISIHNNTFGSTQKGVYVDASNDVSIIGNRMRTMGNQLPATLGRGVESVNNAYNMVINNNIMNGAMDYGIYIDSDGNGGDGNEINSNRILNVTNGIVLGAESDHNTVVGNHITNYSGSPISFTKNTQTIKNNRINSEETSFAVNSTTPSVMRHTPIFKTTNSGSTTITTFSDGTIGQNIKVLIKDANTIIDFTGTNLKGNGGADWSPANGDWMECVFDGTNWYCSVHDCTA
uniref:Putative pectate lyase n=1 Tax=viral metagenome TaxID=1070528 RepID=A0A6M3IJ90_9ZZZZ